MVEMRSTPEFELRDDVRVAISDDYIHITYPDGDGEYHSEILDIRDMKQVVRIAEANPSKSFHEVLNQ